MLFLGTTYKLIIYIVIKDYVVLLNLWLLKMFNSNTERQTSINTNEIVLSRFEIFLQKSHKLTTSFVLLYCISKRSLLHCLLIST